MTAQKYPLFSEESSVEAVNARMGQDIDPRLRQVMSALVRHVHEFVKEVELTPEEWAAGIRFLTETGQICSEWRQEYILLSDVLGVSMLVDAVNHRRPSGATENTVLGPFYVPEAPRYENGANICLDGMGEPLLVVGTVRDVDGRPIPGATVDVWQTNDDGFYDVQQKGVQPDWNLRGLFTTDASGRYSFQSVKPRYYPIPDDGPVGKLLTTLGRHPNRAAHIHFIVKADGYETVTTHIFEPNCPYLDQDAVFGVKPSLIADFRWVDAADEEHGVKTPHWRVDWDFVLTKERS